MAIPSGMAAQVGWVAESTYGTAVTVTKFLPFRSESVTDEYMRSEADDIIAGAQLLRTEQHRLGNKAFSGDISMYLFNRNIQSLFLNTLGSNATTGAGPYLHTVTPGDLTGDMLSLQIGRPDNGGTVRAFSYEGVKVQSLKLATTQGEYTTMDLSIIAEDVATGTALATASYPASLVRYHSNDLAITVAGSAVCARNFEISFDNSFDDTRRCIGSTVIKEPLRNDVLSVTGSMELEWSSLDMYARDVAMTEAALVATWTNGTNIVAITLNAEFTPVSQPVAGRGVVYQTVNFKAIGTTTDALGCTVAITNADTTV